MKEILTNLWLGSYEDASNIELLKSLHIKYILTVMDTPLEHKIDVFQYKFIKAYDILDQDLISHFDDAYEFIDKGRKEGVLVHCLAGISRSGTIVTSYIMKSLKIDPNEAIAKVKEKSYICPNDGFRQQLKIYFNMKCCGQYKSDEYKQFMQICHRDDIDVHNLVSKMPITVKSTIDPVQFKCRKCRAMLFDNTNIVEHCKINGENIICSEEIFVESLSWIDSSNVTGGKINCPKCSAKLGSYTWVGERCVCGNWVVPAFHIAKQKVDSVKPNLF